MVEDYENSSAKIFYLFLMLLKEDRWIYYCDKLTRIRSRET